LEQKFYFLYNEVDEIFKLILIKIL